MTNPTDLMNQYLEIYGVRPQTVRGIKQSQVARSSAQKQQELAQISSPEGAYDEFAGDMADTGGASANETQQDFRNLSPGELEAKYGNQAGSIISARVDAGARYRAPQVMRRSAGEIASDLGLAVAKGGAGLLGLGALGVNLGAKAVGADDAAAIGLRAAQFSQSVNDFLTSKQTDALQGEKENTEAEIRQAKRDTDQLYEQERQSGEGGAKVNQILREFRDVGARVLANPTVLGDAVAEGVGSMAGAGVLARGAAKLAGAVSSRVAPGFQLSEKAASRLATANMAASIGAQEGGSAFQGTTLEAYEILNERYPDMSEKQKAELATQAGELAAATQTPIAAVTGLLVARFEMNPLKAPALAFGTNTVKETIEEGVQGATGTLAQNYALGQAVDRDRDLFEGVGDAAARGMIAGFGTGAVVGSPSLAAGTAAGAAKAGVSAASTGAMAVASKTMRGVNAAVSKVEGTSFYQAIKERAQKIIEEEENASPSSAENTKSMLSGAIETVRSMGERVVETLRSEGAPDQAVDDVMELAKTASFDIAEIDETAPELVRTAVAGSTNRFEAMEALAQVVNQAEEGSADQITAARYLADMKSQVEGLTQHKPMESLDEITPESEIDTTVRGLEAGLVNLLDNPGIKRAYELAKTALGAAVEKGAAILRANEDPTTPESQERIKTALAVAEHTPEKSDIETNEVLLKHAENGTIQLTPVQQAQLLSASALVQAERQLLAAQAEQGIKTNVNMVTGQALTDIPDAIGGVRLPSLAGHARRIIQAYKAGSIDVAKAHLQELMQFAQHFQNKVAAANAHFARGGQGRGDRFMALSSQYEPDGSRKMVESSKPFDVRPWNPASVGLAQTVGKEAEVIASVANQIAQAFPDLGIAPVVPVALDPGLSGPVAEVVARNPRGAAASNVPQTPTNVQPVQAQAPVAQQQQQQVQLQADVEQARAKGAVAAASKKDTAPPAEYSTEQKVAWYEGRDEARQLAAQEAAEAELEAQPAIEEIPVVEEPVTEAVTPDPETVVEEVVEPEPVQVEESPQEAQETPAPESQPVETQEAEIVPDEAPVTAAEVSGIIAEALDAKIPEAEPAVEPAEVVPAPSVAEPAETVKTRFPKLVGHAAGSKITNWFSRAFGLKKAETIKLWSYEGNPIRSVLDMLNGSLEDYLGDNAPEANLTPQEISMYEAFIEKNASGIIRSLNGRIQKFLDAPHSQKETAPRKSFWRQGKKPYNEYVTGRILNLVEENDGKFTLNRELVGMGVLAALQWIQQTNNYGKRKEGRDVPGLLGMSSQEANSRPELDGTREAIAREFNLGITRVEASRSLAQMIRKYWGLDTRKDAPKAYTDGIAEALAKEIIDTMVDGGLLVREFPLNKVIPSSKTAKERTVEIYYPAENVLPETGIPDLIERMVMRKPDTVNFVGTPPKNIAQTQVNNSKAKLTREQKAAIRARQAVPFFVNTSMLEFYRNAGDLLNTLFGGGRIDGLPINAEHRRTLEGRNRTVQLGMQQIEKLAREMQAYAEAKGIPIEEVPAHFEYSFNSMNREQMLGGTTPQNNKLMREVFLPTTSTSDLSDVSSKAYRGFMLAMAQHIGIKLERQSSQDSIDQAKSDLESKYARSIAGLKVWLQNKGPISEELVQTLQSELGGKLNPAAVHALMEYARFDAMSQEERKSFSTSLYLEADGVTNGPINALMLFNPGSFTADWIADVRRGGVLFDGAASMNEAYGSNGGDLYARASKKLTQLLKSVLPETEVERKELEGLLAFMDLFMGDDVTYTQFEDGTFEVSFDRGVTKNPLTITLYGSGANGMADKLATVLVDAIHEKMTEMALRGDANPNISVSEALFPNDPNHEVKFEYFEGLLKDLTGLKFKDPISLSITRDAYTRLKSRMAEYIVPQLQAAITATVGKTVVDTLTDVRMATQVQSIALQYAFAAEVKKRLEAKGAKSSEFLSQQELDEIFDSLAHLVPILSTGEQNFYIANSQRADEDSNPFSQLLSGKMSTPAFLENPANAGVRGMPSLVIGSGDGMMMQNFAGSKAGPGKTLGVFDGLNMPIDMIEEYSKRINAAVAQAWQRNPLQSVADTFTQFLPAYSLKGKTYQEIGDIRYALTGGTNAKETPVAELERLLKVLNASLQRGAMQMEARQNALAQVDFRVDQMAGAASPHVTGGKISLEGMSNEQIEQVLNDLYNQELAKLEERAETLAKATVPEAVIDLSTEHPSGARVVLPQALKSLVEKLSGTGWQLNVLGDQVASLIEQGYQIVAGSDAQLRSWLNQNGMNQSVLDNPGAETVNGVTLPNSKVILLVNPTAETIVHEMIHAATYNTLAAHYAGQDLGPRAVEKVRAIERLEVLAKQFLSLDLSQASEQVQRAYVNARNAMKQALAEGNKAAALNEFMAWGLANQELAEQLDKTEANPLVRMLRDVIDGIKQLMFGKRQVPVLGDMLSNLRFNTAILAVTQKDAFDLFDETALYHSEAYGKSPRLSRINEILQDKVFSYVRGMMVDEGEAAQQNAQNQVSNLTVLADQALTGAVGAGFSMNMQEKSTFQLVVSTMASAIQLDGNALSKASELFNYVTKTLSISDFLANPNEENTTDSTLANEKYNFVLGNYGTQFDQLNRSSLLPVFMGLALTNEEFRKVLAKMPLPADVRNTDGTLDNRIENAGNNVMDWLGRYLSGQKRSDKTVGAVVDSLTEQVLKTAAERQSFISVVAGKAGGVVDTVNDFVASSIEFMSERAFLGGQKIAENATNRWTKVAGEAISAMGGIANRDYANKLGENWIESVFAADLPKPLTDLVNDMIGRTESNAPIYDMIKRVRSWVTKSRQHYREDLPKIIAKQFSRELSKQEWADLHKGIGQTDVAALRMRFTMAQILSMLADPGVLAQEMSRLEADLKAAHPQDFNTLQRKSVQLAEFMNTGKPGTNLLRNALAIAALLGENRTTKYAPTATTEQMVDALVSLYALQGLNQDTKDSLAKLAQGEADGLSFTTEYLAALRKFELRRAVGNAKFNHFKGYLPNAKDGEMTIVVRKTDNYADLRQQSFKMIGVYHGSNLDRRSGTSAYFMVPVSTRANYQQGIMQTVQQTVGGVDLMTGLSHDRSAAGAIAEPKTVARIWRNRHQENAVEPLIPMFDKDGMIMGYERSTNPEIMGQMGQENHLANAMGQWRGRQVEEREGRYVNQTLIERMHQMWEKASAEQQKTQFVNLFDPKVRKDDPVLEDIFQSLPGYVIQDIVKVFGEQFMIRKDLLNDSMGYRDASIRDAWTGNSRLDPKILEMIKNTTISVFGMDGYRKLVTAEKTIQNVMTDLRVIIVVKSMFVPAANLTWNIYQLMSRGVPIGSIGKGMPRKVSEVNDYLKRKSREIEAEAELKAVGTNVRAALKLEAEIQALKDSYKFLSIWPLIDAGELSSISDGMLSQDDLKLSEGRISEYIDRLADKLPASVRTMAKYGLIARDTALFKGLQKTVEYGDFLAKAILYEDLVGRQKKTPEAALAMINEEYVNYDRLPGRTRGAVEQLGLAWFWNFKIRSTKTALSIVRNNPVHALIAMNLPAPGFLGDVGSPLTDNMVAVTGDGRAGFSIGLEMALRAPQLHPLGSVL
jgi:hypothetical protein